MSKDDIAWVMALAGMVAVTGFLIAEYQITMNRLESRAKEAAIACRADHYPYRGDRSTQPHHKATDISWREH